MEDLTKLKALYEEVTGMAFQARKREKNARPESELAAQIFAIEAMTLETVVALIERKIRE